MPTYSYHCKDCDYEFEIFQQMKDKPIKICPNCGGTLIKMIDKGSGFIFKGKGFYQTDYKHTHSSS